jgi:hypothetical protein
LGPAEGPRQGSQGACRGHGGDAWRVLTRGAAGPGFLLPGSRCGGRSWREAGVWREGCHWIAPALEGPHPAVAWLGAASQARRGGAAPRGCFKTCGLMLCLRKSVARVGHDSCCLASMGARLQQSPESTAIHWWTGMPSGRELLNVIWSLKGPAGGLGLHPPPPPRCP